VVTIGLTGGIGSGKSEVARRFAALGAVVVDSDAIAREVVEPGTEGFDAVVAEFGPGVVAPDGGLDREGIGRLVFADPEARRRLNAIVHPRVGEQVLRRIAAAGEADPAAVVINDVPLLVESGLADRYDAVVVVDAPETLQLQRLTGQRGMAESDARARISVQATREQRLAIASFVIDNSGSLETLQEQVEQVWSALRSLHIPG
jgi:dephospho-CoA kinase